MNADSGIYLEYWGLRGKPFENVPDPESFYLSESHSWALNLLEYAIRERKTAALLTGEYDLPQVFGPLGNSLNRC